MDIRYFRLRKDLDSFGYFETLSIDSVPLVEKLLGDLKQTTSSLQKYMKLAHNSIKEKGSIELIAEPYKSDHSKLLRECNDLHLAFLNSRSQNEKDLKDLREQVLSLTEENNKLLFENEKLRTNLRETELDLMKAGSSLKVSTKSSAYGNKNKQTVLSNTPKHTSTEDELVRENLEIKHELNALKKDLRKLRCKCLKVNTIDDLNLEEDLSGQATKNSTNLKYAQDNITLLQIEVQKLQREKNEIEKSYKETLSKQHEAMKRAIQLAVRNKELEKELNDIDQMAIAVEEECNDAVKNKNQKLTKVEKALKDALLEIQLLEKTISILKKEKQDLELNNDILKTEKNRMQSLVEEEVKAKIDLQEQMTNFRLIENDLNLEVDRLVKENAKHKRIIAEMESKLFVAQAPKITSSYGPGGDGLITMAATVSNKSTKGGDSLRDLPDMQQKPLDEIIGARRTASVRCECKHDQVPPICCGLDTSTQTDGMDTCCKEMSSLTDAFLNGCCANMCLQHFQKLLTKEVEKCQCKIKQTLAFVTQERDHYMQEFYRLRDQTSKHQTQKNEKCTDSCRCRVCPTIQEFVKFLEKENKALSEEKVLLMARLDGMRNDHDVGRCTKATCRRIERERDLFQADIKRLEYECDVIRDNMAELRESKLTERAKYSQQIVEYEERLHKLDAERNDWVTSQGPRRAHMSIVEDKCESYKKQLLDMEEELRSQKMLYSQLKTLHTQTDQALLDTQSQLAQLEHELAQAHRTIEELKDKIAATPHKYSYNEADMNALKRQLNRLDQEKDELLNITDSKTEQIEDLKKSLESKNNLIEELRSKNSELRNKLGDITDRASTSNTHLKSAEDEVSRLQRLLDAANRTKDDALAANRKLQEELAVISREATNYKIQLSKSHEQIENLKLQSQQYIGEVKRAKDLIDAKEKEREDLLMQYQHLFKENNHLQNSKDALESEASQSKVQLSVTMDHVNSLEQRSETLEVLISDYEKQIGLLTNQIARFESERNQYQIHQERMETELKTMRELCMKLDKEKEQLRIQLIRREDDGEQINVLRQKNEMLSTKLSDFSTKLTDAERLLNEARQEGVEVKLKNEDTSNEMRSLKKRISDLEMKLTEALRDVDMYQEKALEYSNEIRHLRRRLTNERFQKNARGDADRFPSL